METVTVITLKETILTHSSTTPLNGLIPMVTAMVTTGATQHGTQPDSSSGQDNLSQVLNWRTTAQLNLATLLLMAISAVLTLMVMVLPTCMTT